MTERYGDVPFTEGDMIDDLWEFSRKWTEHRDRVRAEMRELLDSDNPRWMMFLPLKPMAVMPTAESNYVLPQQLPLTCFRGQPNADWNLTPSIRRGTVIGEKGILDDIVREMRIQEFGKMLGSTNRCRQWTSVQYDSPDEGVTLAKGLYLDVRSLAQHFFIHTERLDFTNDVEVALFFACTRNEGGGRYRPLSDDDVQETPYGTIFQSQLLNCSQTEDFKGLSMIPIQPYVRPAMQSGFAYIGGEYDTDLGIVRHVFRHDVEFSRYICERFGNGDLLFKEEGAEWIAEQVDHILESRTFSETAFVRACRHLGIPHKESKRLRKELESHGNYRIGRNAYTISDVHISELEPGWDLGDYMDEVGIGRHPCIIRTAYGNEDGRLIFTVDRPMAGLLGLIRGMYPLLFGKV